MTPARDPEQWSLEASGGGIGGRGPSEVGSASELIEVEPLPNGMQKLLFCQIHDRFFHGPSNTATHTITAYVMLLPHNCPDMQFYADRFLRIYAQRSDMLNRFFFCWLWRCQHCNVILLICMATPALCYVCWYRCINVPVLWYAPGDMSPDVSHFHVLNTSDSSVVLLIITVTTWHVIVVW